MGRPVRQISSTGIYHVMLRGVNQQRVFEQIEDYNAFVRILKHCLYKDKLGNELKTPNFDLYAYCLMDNFIHLLIGTRKQSLSEVVHRIASIYARYFNNQYDRTGHFFHDRYKATVCEDKDSFFELIDYIHRNPIANKIAEFMDEYQFTSYEELIRFPQGSALCNLSNIQERIESVSPVLVSNYLIRENTNLHVADEALEKDEYPSAHYFPQSGADPAHWCEHLLASLKQAKSDKADVKIIDELISECLLCITDTCNMSDFQRLPKKTMRDALAQVRDTGISIRHLSRISGISEGIIRNCK